MCRNDVINQLSTIDEMAQHTQTMIPIQVLTDIDNARNPMQLTRDRLERAATENQFMNGKIAAIDVSISPCNASHMERLIAMQQMILKCSFFLVISQTFGRGACAEFPRAWSLFTDFDYARGSRTLVATYICSPTRIETRSQETINSVI
jgi:hypothetical protein